METNVGEFKYLFSLPSLLHQCWERLVRKLDQFSTLIHVFWKTVIFFETNTKMFSRNMGNGTNRLKEDLLEIKILRLACTQTKSKSMISKRSLLWFVSKLNVLEKYNFIYGVRIWLSHISFFCFWVSFFLTRFFWSFESSVTSIHSFFINTPTKEGRGSPAKKRKENPTR